MTKRQGQFIQGVLHQPTPELLDPVPWWWLIIGLGFNLCQATLEVHIGWLDHWNTTVEARADVEDGEEDEWQVVGHKCCRVPPALQEDAESREEADDHDPDDGVVRSVGVQLGCEWEVGAVNALRPETLIESEIREADTEPGHQSGNGSLI